MEKYLSGIDWDTFGGIPGIYVTSHHLRGYRYFSNYKNGEARKQLIFQKLTEGGVKENRSDWDWHHVVEGNHLRPLFTSQEYSRLYDFEWATVLMHSAEEHKVLNSLFRSKGTSDGLAKAEDEPLKGSDRATYIGTLKSRYQSIYLGDPVLQRVAQNVISRIH